ncbi:ADM_collapsed_G0051240.mRNA.1.CDS.1 [Saccharomyces cerevisiae]|nr:ADM_collapsed_G0051240.mRNA.1.CDS.1 [Saccharomyces cerevisiae]
MNTQELCKIFVAREYPLVVVPFIYFVLFLHQKYHTTLNYVWYPTCSKRIWVREKGRKCSFFQRCLGPMASQTIDAKGNDLLFFASLFFFKLRLRAAWDVPSLLLNEPDFLIA